MITKTKGCSFRCEGIHFKNNLVYDYQNIFHWQHKDIEWDIISHWTTDIVTKNKHVPRLARGAGKTCLSDKMPRSRMLVIDWISFSSGTDTCFMQCSSLSCYISWGSGRDWAIYCMQQVPVTHKWSWLFQFFMPSMVCHASAKYFGFFLITFEHVMWILYLPIHFWIHMQIYWVTLSQ